MNDQTNWWEPIFTGTLEMGVDKEKMETVNEESLLYFAEGTHNAEL